MALLSIIALYNYDEKILNGIRPYLPYEPSDITISKEYEPIDFDILINSILFRAGELSLLYSEPKTFKLMVNLWAARNRLLWQNLYDTLYYKYDPLFSKVRSYTLNRVKNDVTNSEKNTEENSTTSQTENNTENTTRNGGDNYTTNSTRTANENTVDNQSENHSDTNMLYVQAYDDINISKWYGKEKTVTDGNSNGNENINKNSTSNDTGNSDRTFTENIVDSLQGLLSKTIVDKINERLNKNSNGTMHDIISETVTGQRAFQELIKLQREIVQFNLYDYIADDFVKNFCIMIY